MKQETTRTVEPVQRRWISVKEAAEMVPWGYKTFLKMVGDGILPAGIAHRPVPGGLWLIDPAALERWIENGCFTVAPGNDDGGKVADRSPA